MGKSAKKVKMSKKRNKPKIEEDKILCIILKEGKGSKWKWISDNVESFSLDENTYILTDDGTHIEKLFRFMVFLEGVSLPLHHGYIEKEEVEREIVDADTGKKTKITISKIKGLKFDSKVIDMFLNRHLADEFTKEHMDLPNLAIVILLIFNLLLAIANIGMWFK